MAEANARQLVSRARKHIVDGRSAPVSSAARQRLLTAFVAAAEDGDFARLEGLFAWDIFCWSDGGGVVRAARSAIAGSERVAKLISAFASHFGAVMALSPS
jgi:RNA polymerase sigma-70 factor (ECF subfamily)